MLFVCFFQCYPNGTYRQTDRQTDRQRERPADRQTECFCVCVCVCVCMAWRGSQPDRQTDRQIRRSFNQDDILCTHTHTHIHTHTHQTIHTFRSESSSTIISAVNNTGQCIFAVKPSVMITADQQHITTSTTEDWSLNQSNTVLETVNIWWCNEVISL